MRALTDGTLNSIFSWWLAITLCGFLAWPMCAALFPASRDKGYLAAKAAGLLVAAYGAWLASSCGFISFARSGPLVGVGLLVLLCFCSFSGKLPLSPRSAGRSELIFILFLAGGLVIRMTNADIYGLEKFMDFGFLNSGMRATSMPPPDMWFGGDPINYYYFGHVIASWLSLLAGVPADHGYNLMMATVFALVASLVYSLVRDALPASAPHVSRVMAALTAACVVIGGNFHTVVYGAFRSWISSETGRDYYYYPDSTRFIGFDPPTEDKAFTEMPAYGFAVGDMHGHVLNLTINMLLLFVLFHALAPGGSTSRSDGRIGWRHLAAIGFLLGLSIMTNTWDFAIYGLVIAIIGVFAWAASPLRSFGQLVTLFLQGLGMVVIALLVALPFLASFSPFGHGVRLVETTTPLWQFLVLYTNILPGCIVAIISFVIFGRTSGSSMFAAALGAACLVILLLPEVIYLKDIYGHDHARANTMFKFTFQGQTIGIIAAGVTVGLLLAQARGRLSQLLILAVAAPLLMPLIYPNYWLKDRLVHHRIHDYSLDGLGFVVREAPGEERLLPVVRSLPLAPGETILEADGGSYTYASRFSALTGQPAPLGWRMHEWLWRGDWTTISGISAHIADAYQADSPEAACLALGKLSARYVVVGNVERKAYPKLREANFQLIGRERASSGDTRIYEIQTGACPGL